MWRKWGARVLQFVSWIVTPAMVGAAVAAVATGIYAALSGLPAVVVVLIALATLALVVGLIDGVLAILDRLRNSRSATFEKPGSELRREQRDKRAVLELECHASATSTAKIIVFPAHQVPVARRIAALFELAHWSVNFIETPQEPLHHRYVEGVEVSGANSVLVDAVASALTTAGVPSVKRVVLGITVSRDNPKHQHVVEGVRVTIGHTPEGSGLDQPAHDTASRV